MSEETKENQLEKVSEQMPSGSAFSNIKVFENAQRMAKALCQSSLVPKEYNNNVPNTMVAMEMANRIGISPLMVMQNLDIIHGKPSWRSTFIISALNSCGRFKPLRFEFSGEGDNYGCAAYSYDVETNEKIVGTKITQAMVNAEGWANKSGSKWKTMPEQMFQYRAASFFGRLYAPDILTGMHSVEEIIDISKVDNDYANRLDELKELFEKTTEEELGFDDYQYIKMVIEQENKLEYAKCIRTLTKTK